MKRILIPLDGSRLGEYALSYAAPLALAADSEILLLTGSEARNESSKDLCEQYLDRIAGEYQLQQTPPDNVSKFVILGKAADIIISFAQERNVDLIILVSHGRSGIKPWFAGSTAAKIIERTSRPVLMIRAAKHRNNEKVKENPYAKLLLPLDGSVLGEAVLEPVKEIAASMNSEVLILRVIESVHYVRSVGGIDRIVFSDSQIQQLEIEAIAYLDQIALQMQQAGINVTPMVRSGETASTIINVGNDENVDLIAMSSHGKSGFTKWVFGSTSRKILNAGEKNLLLVHPLNKNVT